MSKGWSSRAQRLTIFFYPKELNHEHYQLQGKANAKNAEDSL